FSFSYLLYGMPFFYALPGVPLEPSEEERRQARIKSDWIAQQPGVNRWVILGTCSSLILAGMFLVFWVIADARFALFLSGGAAMSYALLHGLGMLIVDALFGRLRF